MKTVAQLKEAHPGAEGIVIGDGKKMLASRFAYAKPTETNSVYLVGKVIECANGGYCRRALASLAFGGERGDTPQAVATWASEALCVPILN